MRKLILLGLLAFSLISSYSQTIIRADHTIVDDYDNIPQRWIDTVKTKLVWVVGASHAYGYYRACELLAEYNNNYNAVNWYYGDPPAETDTALRIGRENIAEGISAVANPAIREHVQENILSVQNATGNQYDFWIQVLGYDLRWGSLGGGDDPVYNVQWAGASVGGIDGDLRWGLDADDYALTSNRFSTQYYLDQIDSINQYMIANGWDTRAVFATGATDLDAQTELGFQRHLKNKYIRDSVGNTATSDVYFFDYADILCYNNEGELNSVAWNDEGNLRYHDQIHPDNLLDYDANWNTIAMQEDVVEDHIGEVGNLRLAKALWWLIARASGWDGVPSPDTSEHVIYCQPGGVNASDSNSGYQFDYPKATWQGAIDATAGTSIDTIYFRSGTDYVGADDRITLDLDNSGGHGIHGKDSLVFLTWGTDTTIVDGTSATLGEEMFEVWSTTYFKIKGNFIFQNKDQSYYDQIIRQVVFYENSKLWIEGVTSRNSGGYGFTINGWDTLYCFNNDSYEHSNPWSSDPGNKPDGFAIASGGQITDYCEIVGNRAWRCSDDGMEIDPAAARLMDQNWAFCNGYYDGGEGVAFKFGPSYIDYLNNRICQRNIAAWNKGPAYTFQNINHISNGPVGKFYNNLSYKCYVGFQSVIGDWDCTTGDMALEFYNNIFYDSENSLLDQLNFVSCGTGTKDPRLTGHHNTWEWTDEYAYWAYNDTLSWSLNQEDSQWVSLPDSATTLTIMSAPRQSDGSLPDIGDYFKLASTSVLIDAGVDVGLSYSGSSPDLGPFEYDTTIVEPPVESDSILVTTIAQLQDSINTNRVSGDVVYIDAESLTGNITFNVAGVTLRPAIGRTPALTGQVTVSADSITIKQIEIASGTYGIYSISTTGLIVDSCTLTSNTSTAYLYRTRNLTFTNNEITGTGTIITYNPSLIYPDSSTIDYNIFNIPASALFNGYGYYRFNTRFKFNRNSTTNFQ